MMKNAMISATKNDASTEAALEGSQISLVILFNSLENSNFLHLTIHKLNGKNYMKWAQSIKLVIDGKGKLSHLTGEVKRLAIGDLNMKA